MKKPVQRPVKQMVNKMKLVLSTRLLFLLMFTVFYWGYHFIFQKTNLQLSQVVFNLSTGVYTGAVTHVIVTKFFGPFLFGRGFCGWACWNASVFDILPVRKLKTKLSENCYMYKYIILALSLALPFIFICAGFYFQSRGAQLKWLLIENGAIYILGIVLAFLLGDRRAFCKYLCPAGALMTVTAPSSILKIEKNHLLCTRCLKCEEVCPMDVPVLHYVSANQRVAHPECILCTECVKSCPQKCLTVGIGQKSKTTPEFGQSY